MIGSYGPKADCQSYKTPQEEAPTGMMARGSYTVKSVFIDDDKTEHLKWEWTFDIKKDWDQDVTNQLHIQTEWKFIYQQIFLFVRNFSESGAPD